ncbi:hypothetical protein FACS1894151_04970 [Spirochaetia bacterium]|nr:hypothetical protein FACS1894151_04970 [Spirochaetia bacterium]
MSKLPDFYRKAESDPALRSDLEAADFELDKGELDEEELGAVAGGLMPKKSIKGTVPIPS